MAFSTNPRNQPSSAQPQHPPALVLRRCQGMSRTKLRVHARLLIRGAVRTTSAAGPHASSNLLPKLANVRTVLPSLALRGRAHTAYLVLFSVGTVNLVSFEKKMIS